MQVGLTQYFKIDHLLGWWYRIAAPPEVAADAPIPEREAVRIGKLTSAILLFELIYITIVIGVAFTSNPSLLPVLVANYLMILLGVICNRSRRTWLAAIVSFSTLEIGMLFNIVNLAMAGHFDSSNLSLFDALVQPELIAVSLFPAWVVLPVAAFNCLSIIVFLTFLPKTPDLVHVLAKASYTIYQRPIAIQIITALVTYLWVSSAINSMRRADNAEEINRLTQELMDHQRSKIQERQMIERSIDQIVEVHRQVANGNFGARVPLNDTNMFWPLAGWLNNLLARVQHWRQDSVHLKHIQGTTQKMVQEMQIARQQGKPFRIYKTGTELDLLLRELVYSTHNKEPHHNSDQRPVQMYSDIHG